CSTAAPTRHGGSWPPSSSKSARRLTFGLALNSSGDASSAASGSGARVRGASPSPTSRPRPARRRRRCTKSLACSTRRPRWVTSAPGVSLSSWNRGLQGPKEQRRMSEEAKLEELDRLVTMGKQKGFLTYDEVNDALPSDIVSLDQLDDIMMMFGAMDIEVVDSAKAARLPSEVARPAAVVEDDDDGGGGDAIDLSPGPVGRTEDPVRLYLREMGRVALLTREGEIALAKRIEEGKNQVTAAILSTNLALERFRELRESLRHGEISVKEVVDVNEEEFTEEKEEELRRQVVNAFAQVDRLLRDRDELVEQVRKLRAKAGPKPKGKLIKDPAWKRTEAKAQALQPKV